MAERGANGGATTDIGGTTGGDGAMGAGTGGAPTTAMMGVVRVENTEGQRMASDIESCRIMTLGSTEGNKWPLRLALGKEVNGGFWHADVRCA
mmetsp:Transcript_24318/g.48383  ORF Transcript_24318/g.48383 Transcript_24318/m.48383 type:complete len:93 (-) Transcript_24318:331-609(-)